MNKESEVQSDDQKELIDIVTILKNYIHILFKIRKSMVGLILICTLITVINGIRSYHPRYTASATYTINIQTENEDGTLRNESFFDNKTAEQMAVTFPHILTSSVLNRKVAQDLNFPSVPGAVKAEVEEGTNFLTLSVTGSDPELSWKTLQSVVKNYPSISEVVVGKVNMKLMDETGVPKTPDNKREISKMAMKGGMLGLLLGLLRSLFILVTYKTIRSADDCKKRIHCRCVGEVPFLYKKVRSKETKQEINIFQDNIDPDFVEGFRIIRNKLEYQAERHQVKTILITSALAGEGKSTVAVNLALSLAQEGKKVALLDCDLRHPSDAEILNVPEGNGMIDYLRGERTFKECVKYGKEIFSYTLPMLFMQAGKTVEDASKYLSSPRLKKALDKIKEQVDYIIIDSAPVGLLTDATILAQDADSVLFVVRRDYTKSEHIIDAMEQLTDANVYMMGCVLNG